MILCTAVQHNSSSNDSELTVLALVLHTLDYLTYSQLIVSSSSLELAGTVEQEKKTHTTRYGQRGR